MAYYISCLPSVFLKLTQKCIHSTGSVYTLKVDMAFEDGLDVVIVAIVINRLT